MICWRSLIVETALQKIPLVRWVLKKTPGPLSKNWDRESRIECLSRDSASYWTVTLSGDPKASEGITATTSSAPKALLSELIMHLLAVRSSSSKSRWHQPESDTRIGMPLARPRMSLALGLQFMCHLMQIAGRRYFPSILQAQDGKQEQFPTPCLISSLELTLGSSVNGQWDTFLLTIGFGMFLLYWSLSKRILHGQGWQDSKVQSWIGGK